MNSLYKAFQILFILLITCCVSCTTPQERSTSPTGKWRAELLLSSEKIPFNFTLEEVSPGSYQVEIQNAKEQIKIKEVEIREDSIFIQMPVYDSRIEGKLNNGQIAGVFINDARTTKMRIPFRAELGTHPRFRNRSESPTADVSGQWQVSFVYQDHDTSEAKGIFRQDGNYCEGTFMTPTGDYRYLEGGVYGDSLFLSCFDGAHSFLFKAKIESDNQLSGGFWSGDHWYETWSAVRNEDFTLAGADTLTYLKEGYDRLEFQFPNLENELVALSDEKYKDKVVIVQILGSWCPNCWDETFFLAEFHKEYRDQGVEIIALAYERTDDFEKNTTLIRRLKKNAKAEYEFCVAGKVGKSAGESLPMLNHIMAYPTTLFVDREGKVRKIHTGFSGPATGEHFEQLTGEFRAAVEELLGEDQVK